MKAERLVHMANQIADFFGSYPREQAVAGVADHLHKFWDPRMRGTIIQHLADVQLDPSVREAVEQLRESRQE